MSDETKASEETPPEKPKAEWVNREFRINGEMKKVIGLGVKTTEVEIATLKRKLAKLQYGA